jgi:hypothetical protein
VTEPGITGRGPEHEPTGTVIELLGIVVKALTNGPGADGVPDGVLLVKVKLPVTGLTLDDDLQTSRKEHGTAAATAVSSASSSPPPWHRRWVLNWLGRKK